MNREPGRRGVAIRQRRAETGFVALALLVLLLAGTTAAVLAGASRGTDASRPERALAETRRLVAARDALLAYAATYPHRYGPTGAGPGHLPCPDTDATFRLAGPNPPCGGGAAATGRLPAHVTVGPSRIGLDPAADGPPIRYRLDARFANNPARRPLAFAGADSVASGASRVAAELSLETSRGTHLVLTVREDALAGAAELGVAAWFAAVAEPVDGVEREAVAGSGATSAEGKAMSGGEADALALVTRRAPAPDGGEGVPTVEGIPRARHWFALDGWTRALRVTVESGCRSAEVRCAWRIDGAPRRAARAAGSRPLPRIDLAFVPGGDRPLPVEASP